MQTNILEYLDSAPDDKIAVIDGDQSITFGELKRRIYKIAPLFVSFHNKPIAVLLPKSIECIIIDLAIIASGNFYMNLDVKSPTARIKNIIDLIHPSLVYEHSGFTRTFPEEEERINNIDTDPLCIINTSGSTGTPKGVVLNHRSFIDFCEFARETLHVSGNEIIGSLSPTVFDIFSFELCLLMQGSTIVIIPDSLAKFPVDMLSLISKEKVSFIFWVPTIMVNIANLDLLVNNNLSLKTVWFAGEVFPTKQFNYWKRNLPDTEFVNLYGPIEITLDCTYFVVDREFEDNEPLPIGIPCKNTDILILNENNELSDEGELCVRGTSLAMGYYNNPEKTAEVFVQNPLNKFYPELIYRTGDFVSKNERGELMFKGRRDTLIKHSGYRIELTEIEHVVNSAGIKGAVCYDHRNKEIVLFYIDNRDSIWSNLQKLTQLDAITSILPKYMLPNKFIKIAELPMNTNGKIDRLKLNSMIND